MSMRCGQVRRLFWSAEGPLPFDSAVAQAQSHLEDCESCREFVEEMRAFPRRLRTKLPNQPMPVDARERLFTALARERSLYEPKRRLERVRSLATAGVVAAAVATLLWIAYFEVWWDDEPGLPVPAAAEDHMRAQHEETIETSDPKAIARWLRSRVAFHVHVPEFEGNRVTGARLCFLDGRRGAVLTYEVDGRPLSFYVMPDDGSRELGVNSSAFRRDVRAGYNVVTWRQSGLSYALIGEHSQRRLAGLAESCSQQVRMGEPHAG